MTSYLYVLSIGPVQDFIAAARRTRDIWFGSHLLSEISKAAANTIFQSNGKLIFPSPDNPKIDLAPSDELDAFNVANIILAELDVSDIDEIKKLDVAVKEAANKRWMDYANQAFREAKDIIDPRIWNDQISDVIEWYSAYVPKGTSYLDARIRLMQLLAARKATRNFIQPGVCEPGIDKSSLDGARESVLKKKVKIRGSLALRMRRSEGEELCAVGLTKRLGGGRKPFPSVVRIAIDPWVRGICNSGNAEAKRLLEEIGTLCRGENCYSSGTGKTPDQDIFPYDGQVLFPSRIPELIETARNMDRGEDIQKLGEIQKKVNHLQSNDGLGFGEPDPYYAVLMADGDQMGKAISSLIEIDKHRSFSKTLAKFARDARRIVEKEYHGCMVYSGGDDVFAFLPVDTCLAAAWKLHKTFGDLLEDYHTDGEKPPTLSVGIAIGHIRDPLEDIRVYGRHAEGAAKKPDRNGLAIHFHTRGGGDPLIIREQWREKDQNGLDERIDSWVDLYLEDLIPEKVGYDLRQLAEDYRGWKEMPDRDFLKGDVKRLLKKKKGKHGERELTKDDINNIMEGIKSYETLMERATELVLARHIAENKRQARVTIKGGSGP